MQNSMLIFSCQHSKNKKIYSFENFDAFYYESFRLYCEALLTFNNKIPESKTKKKKV